MLRCDGAEQPQPDEVIAHVRRQCTSDQPREWLARRRAACLTTIGSTGDKPLLSSAGARDAACWQLNRPASAVCSLLDGIESCCQDRQVHPTRRQALLPPLST